MTRDTDGILAQVRRLLVEILEADEERMSHEEFLAQSPPVEEPLAAERARYRLKAKPQWRVSEDLRRRMLDAVIDPAGERQGFVSRDGRLYARFNGFRVEATRLVLRRDEEDVMSVEYPPNFDFSSGNTLTVVCEAGSVNGEAVLDLMC